MQKIYSCGRSDRAGKFSFCNYWDVTFSLSYLAMIVVLMNEQLIATELDTTFYNELIKFFSIILLVLRLPNMLCNKLWLLEPAIGIIPMLPTRARKQK